MVVLIINLALLSETSDDSISNVFASKLNQLLNLNPDSLPRDTLISKLNNVIDTSDISAMVISPSMVSEALAHIKRGRNDGSGLASDHFVYASSAIGPFLSDLLRVRNWPSALLATITSLALGTRNITLNKTVSSLTFYVKS